MFKKNWQKKNKKIAPVLPKEPHALCRDLADRPKDRRHKGQILAVWFQTDLHPLWQNLCLASDSKKVKTKSSLNSLGITDMVLDNQWASN